ncbi:hypothetical protein [Alteromonas sp. KUL106]|uniref:hypothetical protein n=1 Tax=Alteromonas sp. KUL106 TaxID=2480799 RepID=UPI0012E5F9BD|nr:hypothetical protein [Alteromonas sp. KUL106]GFD70496.1 hypothetical protein KUL106_37590 [Alteromonas sp. KUL106]
MRNRVSKIGSLFVSLTLLTACGGSGSNDDVSPSTPSAPLTVNILGPEGAMSGDTVDFVVMSPTGTAIRDIEWHVSGLAQQPLNAHTQAIGFDVHASGSYDITVNAVFVNGTRVSDSITLQVDENSAPLAALRLGHEASEGGRVSLRVDTVRAENLDITAIDWRQIKGPAVSQFDYDDGDYSHSIYFQAPSVNSDTVIEIESAVTLANGETLVDTAQVLVKNIDINSNGFFVDDEATIPETVSAHMMPYRADSPYAEALQACVYNNQVANSCTFSTLPLIAQVGETPSIDDILDRTYVSHPWMGDAFKAFLETSSTQEDMLKLFRATTAVVISYDIRPSFYWVATGAIYLDANNLWRTPEERDTLNTRPDYRSGFGNDLDFTTSWRYVKNGAYYFPIINTSDIAQRQARNGTDVEAALSYLLYHELAHANDFFDYTEWQQLNGSASPLSSFDDRSPISTGLTTALPLTSSQLHALAEVRFGGVTASSTQRNYTAQQVANWFEDDGAIDLYAYLTEREDLAMLFERFMMLYRLQAEADVGVFSRDTLEDGSFIPTWAQRNRISGDNVTMRIDYVASRILPELDIPSIQASLPAPFMLPTNISWRDSASSNHPDTQSGNNNNFEHIEGAAHHLSKENTMSVSEEFKVTSRTGNRKANE